MRCPRSDPPRRSSAYEWPSAKGASSPSEVTKLWPTAAHAVPDVQDTALSSWYPGLLIGWIVQLVPFHCSANVSGFGVPEATAMHEVVDVQDTELIARDAAGVRGGLDRPLRASPALGQHLGSGVVDAVRVGVVPDGRAGRA